MALVPWLILLRQLRGRGAFWWSWLVGFLFFLASIWWLVHVTVIGWLVLCAYLALYFGIFGWMVSLAQAHAADIRHQTSDIREGGLAGVWSLVSGVWPLVFIPALWTALEYTRSHLLSGLGWNLLAYSQAPWLHVIQCADVVGAWGVSFLIVLVNVGLVTFASPGTGDMRHETRHKSHVSRPMSQAKRSLCVIVAAVFVVATLGYGMWRLRQQSTGPTVRIAVVQGNIPQAQKWDETYQETILARYEALTQEAAKTQPQLIVWPETAVPGYLGLDESVTQRVFALATSIDSPLLVGAPMGSLDGTRWRITNSAVLLDRNGTIAQRYDKLHLVAFGEFIPGESVFPWLRDLLPPIGDFVPGRHYTVFETAVRNSEFGIRNVPRHVGTPGPTRTSAGAGQARRHGLDSALRTPHSELRFSVLICFEDIFPDLARRFVREGAQMLLVITNDAWFGPTAAAYQHAQASTFRAVELRVPVVRAANTGWSGCIDATGQWLGSVRDASGTELFVSGTHTCEVVPAAANSLYVRWGDWFAWACILITACWLAMFRPRSTS